MLSILPGLTPLQSANVLNKQRMRFGKAKSHPLFVGIWALMHNGRKPQTFWPYVSADDGSDIDDQR